MVAGRRASDTAEAMTISFLSAGIVPALPARTVQERLVALGRFPAEAVTGRYDRPTLDAVARFQAERGLRVDGVPGWRTADALLAV
jgi:murein L,D-transpeptidase YcbB/YkuD